MHWRVASTVQNELQALQSFALVNLNCNLLNRLMLSQLKRGLPIIRQCASMSHGGLCAILNFNSINACFVELHCDGADRARCYLNVIKADRA